MTVAADEDPFHAEALVEEEVDRLIAEGPSAGELKKAKASYLAREIRQLRDPGNLALQLAMNDQIMGGWNRGFEFLDRIETVTAEDVQRVAAERLTRPRRTVAIIEKKGAEEQAQGGQR